MLHTELAGTQVECGLARASQLAIWTSHVPSCYLVCQIFQITPTLSNEWVQSLLETKIPWTEDSHFHFKMSFHTDSTEQSQYEITFWNEMRVFSSRNVCFCQLYSRVYCTIDKLLQFSESNLLQGFTFSARRSIIHCYCRTVLDFSLSLSPSYLEVS